LKIGKNIPYKDIGNINYEYLGLNMSLFDRIKFVFSKKGSEKDIKRPPQEVAMEAINSDRSDMSDLTGNESLARRGAETVIKDTTEYVQKLDPIIKEPESVEPKETTAPEYHKLDPVVSKVENVQPKETLAPEFSKLDTVVKKAENTQPKDTTVAEFTKLDHAVNNVENVQPKETNVPEFQKLDPLVRGVEDEGLTNNAGTDGATRDTDIEPKQEEPQPTAEEIRKENTAKYSAAHVGGEGNEAPSHADIRQKIAEAIKEKPTRHHFVPVDKEMMAREFPDVSKAEREEFDKVPTTMLDEFYSSLEGKQRLAHSPQEKPTHSEIDEANQELADSIDVEEIENTADLSREAKKAKISQEMAGIKDRFPELLGDDDDKPKDPNDTPPNGGEALPKDTKSENEPELNDDYDVVIGEDDPSYNPKSVAPEEYTVVDKTDEPKTAEEQFAADPSSHDLDIDMDDDTPPKVAIAMPEKPPLDIEFGENGTITNNVEVVNQVEEIYAEKNDPFEAEIKPEDIYVEKDDSFEVGTDPEAIHASKDTDDLSTEDIPNIQGETREPKKSTSYTYTEALSKAGIAPEDQTHTKYELGGDDEVDQGPSQYNVNIHDNNIPLEDLNFDVKEGDIHPNYDVNVTDLESLTPEELAELGKAGFKTQEEKVKDVVENVLNKPEDISPVAGSKIQDETPYVIPKNTVPKSNLRQKPEYIGGEGIEAEVIDAKEAGTLLAESKKAMEEEAENKITTETGPEVSQEKPETHSEFLAVSTRDYDVEDTGIDLETGNTETEVDILLNSDEEAPVVVEEKPLNTEEAKQLADEILDEVKDVDLETPVDSSSSKAEPRTTKSSEEFYARFENAQPKPQNKPDVEEIVAEAEAKIAVSSQLEVAKSLNDMEADIPTDKGLNQEKFNALADKFNSGR
jgi:hypothetical protein